MKKKICFATFITFIIFANFNKAIGQCKIDYSNYDLILDEQFDSYGGNVANLLGPTSIWNARTDIRADGFAGWGIEYFDPSQISLISDGTGGYRLRLTAEPLAVPITGTGRKYAGDSIDLTYKSGLLTLKNTALKAPSYVSPYVLPTTTVQFDDPSGCTVFDRDPRGWEYGIFEIRCKLPSGGTDPRKWDTWPAFWLIGPDAELDIIDNISENPNIMYSSGKIDWKKQPWATANPDWVPTTFDISAPQWSTSNDYKLGNIVSTQNIYWPYTWIANKDIVRADAGRIVHSPYRNLETEFTTYTGVWTPDKITFFVEGKEVYTINAPYSELGSNCGPLNMIVDLQIHPSANDLKKIHYMDIDYIRIYKPKQLNYSLPYKSNSEFVHEAFEEKTIGDHISISPYPNSIAINTSDPDEIYYRGIDNYIYVSNKIGGSWYTKKLEFNDGTPSLVAGDIKYLPVHDKIVYVGANNRINLFGRSTVEPCGYYHWYLRDDWWSGTYDLIPTESGVIQVTPNGNDIFFKGGIDNKMHRYSWDIASGKWIHSVLYHPPSLGTSSLVKNDIVIDPVTYNLLYKGNDNRLQTFWKDISGTYNHTHIDNNWSSSAFKIKDVASSLTFATNVGGALYIGIDNKIHLYKYVGGSIGWDHELLPYSYSSPTLSYLDADLAKGSIDWDNTVNKLYYGGYDGRVQCFYFDWSTWHHIWISDFWNTDEFNSFESTLPSDYVASLSIGSESSGKYVYYAAYTGSPYTLLDPSPAGQQTHRLVSNTKRPRLVRFKWDACEYSYFPSDDAHSNIRTLFKKSEQQKNDNESVVNKINIYPTIATSTLTIGSKTLSNEDFIIITDLSGRIVLKQNLLPNKTNIDVLNLHSGIYIVEIHTKKEKYNYKFTKI